MISFSVFPGLKSIILHKNEITMIEDMGELPNLIWLDLSGNKIERIENLGRYKKL